MSQYFEIPIRAIPKQAPRAMTNKKGRVTFFQPKAIKVAEHFIRNYIRRQQPKKLLGPLSIKVEFIYQRPKTNKMDDVCIHTRHVYIRTFCIGMHVP